MPEVTPRPSPPSHVKCDSQTAWQAGGVSNLKFPRLCSTGRGTQPYRQPGKHQLAGRQRPFEILSFASLGSNLEATFALFSGNFQLTMTI